MLKLILTGLKYFYISRDQIYKLKSEKKKLMFNSDCQRVEPDRLRGSHHHRRPLSEFGEPR